MAAEEFAEKVADDVIGGANGKIWRGGYSSIARLFNILMPTGVLVSLSSSSGPFIFSLMVSVGWDIVEGSGS